VEKPLFSSDVSGLNQRHNDVDDLRINKPNEFLSRKKWKNLVASKGKRKSKPEKAMAEKKHRDM